MVRTRVRPAQLGPAGWTIAVFGALALLLGAAGLLAPQLLLALLGFATLPAAGSTNWGTKARKNAAVFGFSASTSTVKAIAI